MTSSFSLLVAGPAWQVGLVGAGSLLLVAVPPDDGRMLVVPMTARAKRQALPLALRQRALLVGIGPVRGSFVVQGNRALLAGPLAEVGALLMAAPPSGCGGRGTAA